MCFYFPCGTTVSPISFSGRPAWRKIHGKCETHLHVENLEAHSLGMQNQLWKRLRISVGSRLLGLLTKQWASRNVPHLLWVVKRMLLSFLKIQETFGVDILGPCGFYTCWSEPRLLTWVGGRVFGAAERIGGICI